jgi:hypothetical protein
MIEFGVGEVLLMRRSSLRVAIVSIVVIAGGVVGDVRSIPGEVVS